MTRYPPPLRTALASHVHTEPPLQSCRGEGWGTDGGRNPLLSVGAKSMGNPRKPTSLLRLQGTFRKDRHAARAASEPVAEGNFLQPRRRG